MLKVSIVSSSGDVSTSRWLELADAERIVDQEVEAASRAHLPLRHISIWRQTFNPDGWGLVREVVPPRIPLTETIGEERITRVGILTERETDVLRLLVAGLANKRIALLLGLSVRTVETHRLNLRRKTRLGRLEDLCRLAEQLGVTQGRPDQGVDNDVEEDRTASGEDTSGGGHASGSAVDRSGHNSDARG